LFGEELARGITSRTERFRLVCSLLADQHLHAGLGFFELGAAGVAQLHAAREQIERAIERQVAGFEFFDHFFEFVERGFEARNGLGGVAIGPILTEHQKRRAWRSGGSLWASSRPGAAQSPHQREHALMTIIYFHQGGASGTPPLTAPWPSVYGSNPGVSSICRASVCCRFSASGIYINGTTRLEGVGRHPRKTWLRDQGGESVSLNRARPCRLWSDGQATAPVPHGFHVSPWVAAPHQAP